jgi:glycosyltransferase involved in cell wall biosynthesis
MVETDAVRTEGRSPLVSIIIPCWNGASYLGEAINSALSQTYKPVEVIFVDDGSSDGSLEKARSFAGITVISQRNSGVSAARNAGFAEANGDFIVFLDADDRLYPDAVKLHLEAFSQPQYFSMVYGANRIISAQGDVIEDSPQLPRVVDWRDILMGTTPIPSQSMFRRQALVRAGMFNPDISLAEDFDLYLRLTFTSPGYSHGNFVGDYRRHPAQATKNVASSLVSMIDIVEAFKTSLDSEHQQGKIWARSGRHWPTYFGQYIPIEIIKSIGRRDWKRASAAMHSYLKYMPYTLLGSLNFAASRFRLLGVRKD